MRGFFKLIFLLIVLSPFPLAVLLYLAIETQPAVPNRNSELTPATMERAKRIIDKNDPRKLKSGDRRTISTSVTDLDLAANYLAHLYGRGSARVRLANGGVDAGASLRLPLIPTALYINLEAAFKSSDAEIQLASLRLGKLPVPTWAAKWAMPRLLRLSARDLDYDAFSGAVKKISVSQDRLAITYEWQERLGEQLRALVIPPEEQERLRSYQARLVEVSQTFAAKSVPMTELLVPLFKLAAERSDGKSATAENRAALLVLTIHINGRSLDKIIPAAKSWPRPAAHRILLNHRDDFPKHFIVSAALAANAGGPLADAVGLYKEVDDSRGGSGFSFNDIAADRAGSKFGEYAAHSAKARTLQKKLRAGIREQDIMPATEDLPEFMQEREFKRRFGGIDAPEYKKMMREIERRVAALPLYR